MLRLPSNRQWLLMGISRVYDLKLSNWVEDQFVKEEAEQARVVRIKNTLHLTELDVSEVLLSEVKSHPALNLATDSTPLVFDERRNLLPF